MGLKGLKVNAKKTEVTVSSGGGTRVDIKDRNDVSLKQVDKFKYLGVTIDEKGGSESAQGKSDCNVGKMERTARNY